MKKCKFGASFFFFFFFLKTSRKHSIVSSRELGALESCFCTFIPSDLFSDVFLRHSQIGKRILVV